MIEAQNGEGQKIFFIWKSASECVLQYEGFPTRIVYLYNISCLRYTILVSVWIILFV